MFLRCFGHAIASLAIATGAQAQTNPEINLPLPAKRFVFDNGLHASTGVKFLFTRPVPTVDPEGTPVRAGAPRYAPPTSIASAPRFEQVRATNAPIAIFGSGLDHDGVTPLLVTYEAYSTHAFLDVFVGAGADLVIAEQTGVGRNRTLIGADGDLMHGSIPGKRFRITCGTVCHGLVVLFATMLTFDTASGSWLDAGNGFVVSQDQGRTWSLAYQSPEFAPGPLRGAPWSMQNWWPTKRGAAPHEAYFAATDYCANPGSPGGRFYIMRARRPSSGAWVTEPGAVAMSVEGNVGEHMHTGGVIPLSDGGIRAFLALGDRRPNNRIVSLINHEADYTSGNWDVIPDYHGSAGPLAIANEGNQFVGCAPGPWEGSALVGADLTIEQVMLLQMDEHAQYPKTQRLIGFPTLDGTANNTFVIRTPTPELGGPYCANTEPFNAIQIPFTRRTLYSPDGLHWAQAAAPPSGYPTIHGPDIYFDGTPGQGLLRIDVPAVVVGKPLIVGPGGIQHTRSNPDLNIPDPSRFRALTRNAQGLWIDDGKILDSQPPCMGPVYKVTTHRSDASPWIARIYPATLANPVNSILGTHIQVRAWVRQMDPTKSATFSLGIGDSLTAPQHYRNSNMPSINGWNPLVLDASLDIAPNMSVQLYARCVGEDCNDQTVYLALDTLQEGFGLPGYPMPPDTSVPAVGSPRPDEQARITGFACLKAWTVTLALQIPEDGFDYRARTQTRWPLATIWGDSGNYIELVADTADGTVSARITAGGRLTRILRSDASNFVRSAPIIVSIAQPLGEAGHEMTISAAGQDIHTRATLPAFNSTARLVTQPREIRFFSPTAQPSSTGRGAATSPLLIWGGRIDERRALTRAQREDLLRTLSFLVLPVR